MCVSVCVFVCVCVCVCVCVFVYVCKRLPCPCINTPHTRSISQSSCPTAYSICHMLSDSLYNTYAHYNYINA